MRGGDPFGQMNELSRKTSMREGRDGDGCQRENAGMNVPVF